MKKLFFLFVLLLNVNSIYAQTFTFNMHQRDNTKYCVEVDVQHRYINATKGGNTVLSCPFYKYLIDRQQNRIGLSIQNGSNAVTNPGGSSYFIISRGKGISTKLTNGTELSVMCDNASSQASTYDQLVNKLNSMGSTSFYYVKNEQEFIKALGSNRTITIAPGTTLNISKVLNDNAFCRNVGIEKYDYANLPNRESLLRNTVDDGLELIINRINNLTIQCDSKTNPSKIVVEPRWSESLYFRNCNKITLINVVVGHTVIDEFECEAGVLCFSECNNVAVFGCNLFGCGSVGITFSESSVLNCFDSEIYECTSEIMNIWNSNDLLIKNCSFHDIGDEYSGCGIHNSDCRSVKFYNCSFKNIKGQLISCYETPPMEFHDCVIQHPKSELGDWNSMLRYNCTVR